MGPLKISSYIRYSMEIFQINSISMQSFPKKFVYRMQSPSENKRKNILCSSSAVELLIKKFVIVINL
jgi:hypothetical protein